MIESAAMIYFIVTVPNPVLAIYHLVFMLPSVLYHYSDFARKNFMTRLIFYVISNLSLMLLIINLYALVFGDQTEWLNIYYLFDIILKFKLFNNYT